MRQIAQGRAGVCQAAGEHLQQMVDLARQAAYLQRHVLVDAFHLAPRQAAQARTHLLQGGEGDADAVALQHHQKSEHRQREQQVLVLKACDLAMHRVHLLGHGHGHGVPLLAIAAYHREDLPALRSLEVKDPDCPHPRCGHIQVLIPQRARADDVARALDPVVVTREGLLVDRAQTFRSQAGRTVGGKGQASQQALQVVLQARRDVVLGDPSNHHANEGPLQDKHHHQGDHQPGGEATLQGPQASSPKT